MKETKFLTAMLLAITLAVTLAFGMAMSGCDQEPETDEDQAPQSGLTLKGTAEGATYAVRVYPFIEDGTKDANAWAAATADGELAAQGGATAEGAEVLVSLTAPDESRFAQTGSFIVVVVKTDGTERYAVVAFQDGSVTLELAKLKALPKPPENPGYGIELSQTGTLVFDAATEGYSALKATTITVTNTGTAETGELTVAVAGDKAGSFTLSKNTISSITKTDGTATFTIVPNTGLKAGVYTATVSVTGDNGISAEFEVSFEAGAATYGIDLSQTETLVFQSENPGYGPLTAKAVTISNTGNQPTGALTLKVSNTDFMLSMNTLSNIAAGRTADFNVRPNIGLSEGPHNATVTVSGDNGISAEFKVSFEVGAGTFGITLSRTEPHSFGEVTLHNYIQPTALSVTVTNTGNQPTGALTVALEGNDSGSFTVTPPSLSSIAKGGTATFTVAPKGTLDFPKTHEATVKVTGGNGISEEFGVSFKVNPAPSYGIGLSQKDTHSFGAVTLPNYTQPDPLSVTVTSTSNQPTGTLKVELEGSDKDSFTVTQPSPNSLATKDGTATFTVVPNANITEANTYEATVKVTGGNGITAAFGVSFTVKPIPVYSITLSRNGEPIDADYIHQFGAVTLLPTYSQPASLSVTITNSGNQSTGALTVALEGADKDSFTVTTPNPSIIEKEGGTVTFNVRPKGDLTEAKTHEATVKVTGDNNISVSFGVSFTVNPAPVYSIGLDPQIWTFPSATVGYGAQPAKTVNISNTGNQSTGSLTLSLSNSTAFTLSPTPINSIAAGTSGSFTVTPNTGLGVGPYSATVTVSGGNGIAAQTFEVSFVVDTVPEYDISVSPVQEFAKKGEGYAAITPLEITVTNIGNRATGALTATLADEVSNTAGISGAGAFVLADAAIGSIAAIGDQKVFRAGPRQGLTAGTAGLTVYTAKVVVSGGSGDSAVSKSVNLKFTVVKNRIVSFNVNGGNPPVPAQTVMHGGLASEPPANSVSKANLWFRHWYADGQTAAFNFAASITADTQVNALWEADVAFNLTGGDGMISPQSVKEGGKAADPGDPAWTYHRFDGWYTQTTGGAKWDFDENTVTGHTVLYARWTALWTVTFNLNGGTLDGDIPNQIILNGETATQPATAPAKTDLRFGGWYTAMTGGSKWDFASAVTENLALYARWVPIPQWTVTLVHTPSSQYFMRDSTTHLVNDGSVFTPPTPSPTVVPGLVAGIQFGFQGWSLTPQGPYDYNFVTSVTVTSNMSLYAKWVLVY